MKASQLCLAILGCVLANTVVVVVGIATQCQARGCTSWGTACPKQGCDVFGNPCPKGGCDRNIALLPQLAKPTPGPPKPKHLYDDAISYLHTRKAAQLRHDIYTEYNVNASAVNTFLERVPQWLKIQYYWDPLPQRRAALLHTYPLHFTNVLVRYLVNNGMVYSSAVPKIVYVPKPSVSLNDPSGPVSLNQPPTLPGIFDNFPIIIDDPKSPEWALKYDTRYPNTVPEGNQDTPEDGDADDSDLTDLERFMEDNPMDEGSLEKFIEWFQRFFKNRVRPQNVPAADDYGDSNPDVDSPALDDVEEQVRQTRSTYTDDNFTPPKDGDADGDGDAGDAAAEADADADAGEAGLAGILAGVLVG